MIQAKQPVQLRTENGTALRLTNHLTTSGEADIWWTTQPGTLAKIYHDRYRIPAREHKLQAMVKLSLPSATFGRIVWPRELLYGRDGKFVGYLMPEIQRAYSWRRISVPSLRQQFRLSLNLHERMLLCLHLSQVIEQAHEAGIVLGDLKPENLLVNDKRQVFLLDTDSCQFQNGAQLWRCPVGTPAYTPPELQGARFDQSDQEPGHDSFRLAVLIYELLMGHHPYQGKPRDGSAPSTQAQNIAAREWVWRQHGKLMPGPGYTPAGLLPPRLFELFRKAFDLSVHQRPTAAEFTTVLLQESARLLICPLNSEHRYSPHLADCCWCKPQLLTVKHPVISKQVSRLNSQGNSTPLTVRTVSEPPSPSLNQPTLWERLIEFPGQISGDLLSGFMHAGEKTAEWIGDQFEKRPWATWSATFCLALPLIVFVSRWLSSPDHALWFDTYFNQSGPILKQHFTYGQIFQTCFTTLTSWMQLVPSSVWWSIGIGTLVLSALSEGIIGAIIFIAALAIGLVHFLLAGIAAGIWWLLHHVFSLLGFCGIQLLLTGDRLVHSWLNHAVALPLREHLLATPALGWMVLTLMLLPLMTPIAWGIGYYIDNPYFYRQKKSKFSRRRRW